MRLLRELRDLTERLISDEFPLDEVRALREFVEYEISKSGETYRLLQGVEYLEKALLLYRGWMNTEEQLKIEYALLGELLNTFLTGNQITGGRLAHLNRLIEQGELVRDRVPASNILLKARYNIVLGEAFKEKAMVTENLDEHRRLYLRARDCCTTAINSLRNLDGDEMKQLLGTAYRHLAVTFEVEGDDSSLEDERSGFYRQWSSYSELSVDVLGQINEDATRAYALMNLASSYNRLVKFESLRRKKLEILNCGEELLDSAFACLDKVDDHRGKGWVHIHMCENLQERLKDGVLEARERQKLLLKLERAANRAVAELKLVEDHLAQGLAYEQLGIALMLAYKEAEEKPHAKLVRAKAALWESTIKLARTGYYRGEGEAYRWIARCAFQQASEAIEENEKKEGLLEAINAAATGLIITAKKLYSHKNLEKIFARLERQLSEML